MVVGYDRRNLNHLHTRKYTSQRFIALLLLMLYKNEVYSITEKELSEKLFDYYENPLYKDLFKGISQYYNQERIDISKEISYEKNIRRTIIKGEVVPERLSLRYEEDDICHYQNFFNREDIDMVNKIAYEIALRHKIEIFSPYHMNIRGINPNKEYILIKGSIPSEQIEWELITDGEIKSLNSSDGIEYMMCEDPRDSYKSIMLKDRKVEKIELKKARYAILRGIVNDKIKNLKIYTNLKEFYLLQRISDIAIEESSSNSGFFDQDRPHIKQIILTK